MPSHESFPAHTSPSETDAIDDLKIQHMTIINPNGEVKRNHYNRKQGGLYGQEIGSTEIISEAQTEKTKKLGRGIISRLLHRPE